MLKKIMDWRIRLFEKTFRKITLEDKPWVDALCERDNGKIISSHFASIFLYQDEYNSRFRKLGGCLAEIPEIYEGDDRVGIGCPVGAPEDRKKAYEMIRKVYARRYKETMFYGASEENLKELQELYGDRIVYVENERDLQCYILDAQEQITLEGPRFFSRRKKIGRFDRAYSWSQEAITKENMAQCLEINRRWLEGHSSTKNAQVEQNALQKAFEHYDQLGLKGDLYRIDGKAVAFCVGVPYDKDMFMILYMKADNEEYKNITTFFEYQFIRNYCSGYSEINEGEDMGLPGLRTFKTNLLPKRMLPYYLVTIRN